MLRFRNKILLVALALSGLSGNFSNLSAQDNGPQRGKIPTGPWRIAGKVVNTLNGAPLARTRVTIMDAKIRENVQVVISSDDGRFEFHVPGGKFALQGAKRGFITAAYNQHDQFSTAIVTGLAGVDAENLTLRLSPNAVLSGKVLDEFGEPVREAQIIVYRENRFSGVSRISRFRGASTDDQGRYEVTPLDEGTYFVSAKATPWYAVHPISAPEGSPEAPVQVDTALDVAYPLTFYGDTVEADEATPIPVRGGDRLEADIHLNPSPALHLLFHGGENGNVASPQILKPVFDGMEDVEAGALQNVSPGVFELTGIAMGRYMVRMPDAGGQLKEPAAANLTSNQELDGASGQSTSKVKVKVEVAGTSSVPPQIQIGLRNSKGRVIGSEVDGNREANFTDIVAGKYDVLAGSQNESFSVARLAWDGGSTLGRTLTVPAGAELSILVSLNGGSVTVDGFAKRGGKGIAGAMVVLIPKNPEENHDRFRRDQTDLDGSFTLFNVSPGSYTVIAIEDGWDLDWAKPAVLANYGRKGQPLIVGAQFKQTVHLGDPVNVVPK
jgi:hypothetical protein